MITRMTGDIFRSSCQTLVNPVNCVGVMGAGLALQFRNRFPEMFTAYKTLCNKSLLRMGKTYLWKDPSSSTWILNFPTKRHWRDVSLLEDIEAGLIHLQDRYRIWGITSLAVPMLGCGLGGLRPVGVEPILTKALEQFDIPVELYVL